MCMIIYWKEQYTDDATLSKLIEAIEGPIVEDHSTALKIQKNEELKSTQKSK